MLGECSQICDKFDLPRTKVANYEGGLRPTHRDGRPPHRSTSICRALSQAIGSSSKRVCSIVFADGAGNHNLMARIIGMLVRSDNRPRRAHLLTKIGAACTSCDSVGLAQDRSVASTFAAGTDFCEDFGPPREMYPRTHPRGPPLLVAALRQGRGQGGGASGATPLRVVAGVAWGGLAFGNGLAP